MVNGHVTIKIMSTFIVKKLTEEVILNNHKSPRTVVLQKVCMFCWNWVIRLFLPLQTWLWHPTQQKVEQCARVHNLKTSLFTYVNKCCTSVSISQACAVLVYKKASNLHTAVIFTVLYSRSKLEMDMMVLSNHNSSSDSSRSEEHLLRSWMT